MPYWSKDLNVGDIFTVTVGQWYCKKVIYVACIPDYNNDRLKSILEKKL